MLMYLYGPDSYRRTAVLQEKILAPYQKKYPDGAVERFNLSEEADLSRLKDFSATASLFAKTRLGVVSEVPEAPKEAKEIFKSVLEDSTVTLVVLAEKKLTKEFDFLLKEPIKSYEFEILKGKEFAAFVKKEAEKREVRLSPEDLINVANRFEGDSWAAATELDKLTAGASVEKFSKAPDFFSLIMRLKSSRSEAERLKYFSYLIESNEPALIFNMLASLTDASGKQRFADYDIAIKSGKLEYEEALLDFVLS